MERQRMKKICRICLLLALLLGLTSCGKSTEAKWQEQYDLGMKYVSEGNYEEAIIAFAAAIEIDPKSADAYLALADIYEAQGDTESLQAILEQGLEAAGDARLQERLEEQNSPRTERIDQEDGSYLIWEELENGGMRIYHYDADGTLYAVTENDADRVQIYSASYNEEGSLNVESWYDPETNTGKVQYYGEDGQPYSYELEEYYEPGRMRSSESYSIDGSFSGRKVWEYAEDGSYVISDYNSDNELYRQQYFDADRNLTDTVEY